MEKTQTHWKKLYNPNYFGCYCFEDGKDIIGTIAAVGNETIVGEKGKKEEVTIIHFKEKELKPLICNVTNSKTISKIFQTPFIEEWVGRKIQMFPDRNVTFGKETVEGVRIRPFIPKVVEENVSCMDCKSIIKPTDTMTVPQIVDYTNRKYGKALCTGCASKLKEKMEAEKGKGDVLNGIK